ncbi:MAG: hypothetical protein ACOVRM_01510, partial [Planctomycetaceae bacterium]
MAGFSAALREWKSMGVVDCSLAGVCGLWRRLFAVALLLSALLSIPVSAQDPQLRFGSDVPREV